MLHAINLPRIPTKLRAKHRVSFETLAVSKKKTKKNNNNKKKNTRQRENNITML